MREISVIIVCFFCLTAPASARDYCHAPLGDWRPREALQSKLEQQGWTVQSIRADNGCFKVRAQSPSGERLEGLFDPATLEAVPRRNGHDGHGEDDEGDGQD